MAEETRPQKKPSLRMAKRIVTLTIDHPAYEGFEFRAWVNYPASVTEDMQSADESRVKRAIGQIIEEHNFVDYDGNPLPQPQADNFLEVLPADLAGITMTLIQQSVGKLPKATGTR